MEFIIDTGIVLVSILAVVGFIISYIPKVHNMYESNYKKAKAYQISDFLLFNNFSSGRKYFVNLTKMNSFFSSCSGNYKGTLNSMNVPGLLIVEATNENDEIIGSCGPVERLKKSYYIRRFGIFKNETSGSLEIVTIMVGVY